MPEIEIHSEGEQALDNFGRNVGILAAVLAVCLALVTIVSHRSHTRGIMLKTEANDKWEYYQAERMKFHNLELGEDLMTALGGTNEAAVKMLAEYRGEKSRYDAQAKQTQDEAQALDNESRRAEDQAFRYDVGEGLLEISVILSSLYFISKRRLFPMFGVTSGILGVGIAISGLFL